MSDDKSVLKTRPLRQWLAVSAVVVLFVAVATCFYSAKSQAADYVPLVLVFLAAIAAVRGKSWMTGVRVSLA